MRKESISSILAAPTLHFLFLLYPFSGNVGEKVRAKLNPEVGGGAHHSALRESFSAGFAAVGRCVWEMPFQIFLCDHIRSRVEKWCDRPLTGLVPVATEHLCGIGSELSKGNNHLNNM
ncbi:hypothetical protein RRG08_018718 [Elysia crispata]|uniref:Secreted protein n=1 Tax=Elysia crispata TaxID=231223 RepID=A0AAE0YFU2_9GAST|nr:hypothetical protein RRG08_018718 [Elysia crispata]